MMVTWCKVLVLALAWSVRPNHARVYDPTQGQYCWKACLEALSELTWAGTPSMADDYDAGMCENSLYVQSVYSCARAYCTTVQIRDGFHYFWDSCTQQGFHPRDIDTTSNLTWKDIDHLPKVEKDETTDQVNVTTIPSRVYFDVSFRTTSWWYDGREHHLWYSKAMFIFWGIVLGVGVGANMLSLLKSQLSTDFIMRPEGQGTARQTSSIQRMWTRVRAHFLLPALVHHRCNEATWFGVIPPRAETVIISTYIALNVITGAVTYSALPDNLFWDFKSVQIWRLISDRMGYLAIANITISFVFGVRNNILIWLTGWHFPTFNRFHRWVARVATLEAVLHSIGYTVETFLDGGYADYSLSWKERYWWCGAIAVTVMSLLMGFSALWFRVKAYDIFLLIHLAGALTVLVAVFYHVEIWDREYDGFLWPCVAFWVFDRACRICRVVYFSFGGRLSKALMEFSEEEQIVRIDVTDVMRNRRVFGGQHFFLYSPLAWLGWQSHPFTLVRWIESRGSTPSSDAGSDSSINEKFQEKGQDQIEPIVTTAAAQLSTPKIPEGDERYVFLIRPLGGYTKRLSRAVTSCVAPVKATFFFEGPYGHIPCFGRFAEVLMIIGGSGVSVAISHVYAALEQSPHSAIKLVWTCRRSQTYMDTLASRELKVAFDTGRLSIDAYVTGKSHKDIIRTPSAHKVTHLRPDIPALLHEAVISRRGPLAVVTCGPNSMTDHVRAAFVSELKRDGNSDIQLFLEAFNW